MANHMPATDRSVRWAQEGAAFSVGTRSGEMSQKTPELDLRGSLVPALRLYNLIRSLGQLSTQLPHKAE